MSSIKDTLKLYAARQTDDGINPVFQSVFYGNDFETNCKADDTTYPMCQIVQILTGGFDINPKAGGFKDRYNIFIFFCDKDTKTDLDTTADLNDDIVEAMRLACKNYVANLNQYSGFDIISNVDFVSKFFKFDACVTGVLASFRMTQKEYIKVCKQDLLPIVP